MLSYKPYLDFVRYSIGNTNPAPVSAESLDWEWFLGFCDRQGITGMVYAGIERSGINIPTDTLLEWYGAKESIAIVNHETDKRCRQVSDFFEEKGFRSCILKGQANAMMYPQPGLRSPGDIDIWVSKRDDGRRKMEDGRGKMDDGRGMMDDGRGMMDDGRGKMDDGRRLKEEGRGTKEEDDAAEIIRMVLEVAPEGHYSLHHVTMPVFDDVAVEVHYRPVFLDNWWKDKLLQHYINEVKDEQFRNRIRLSDGETVICGLTDDFNVVFLMFHMWHHLLSTRNNFKQLIDYYYLLKQGHADVTNITELFRLFGVLKYARGIMWIEHEVLGLDKKYLVVEPDERIGKLLLKESLHYGEGWKQRNRIGTLVGRLTDNLHLLWHFPSAVMIAPIYLLWHQWWKLRMKIMLRK